MSALNISRYYQTHVPMAESFYLASRSRECLSLPVTPLGFLLGTLFSVFCCTGIPESTGSDGPCRSHTPYPPRWASVLKGRPRRCYFGEHQAVFTTGGVHALYYRQSDSKYVFSDPFNKWFSQPGQCNHFFLLQMLY